MCLDLCNFRCALRVCAHKPRVVVGMLATAFAAAAEPCTQRPAPRVVSDGEQDTGVADVDSEPAVVGDADTPTDERNAVDDLLLLAPNLSALLDGSTAVIGADDTNVGNASASVTTTQSVESAHRRRFELEV